MSEERDTITPVSESATADHSDEEENLSVCNKKNAREEKRINRLLIDISDDSVENEEIIDKVYVGGSLEKFQSWENVVPNPKYIVPKKKKPVSQEDASLNEEQHNKTEKDPFAQCYEIDFVDCPAWKMGVEPLTYRYIPHHGRYRAYKLGQRLVNANRLRGNGKLDYDRQKLRSAIQNELTKEFEMFIKFEKQKFSILRQQELAEKNKKAKKQQEIEEVSTEKTNTKSERKTNKLNQEENKNFEETLVDQSNFQIDDYTPRSNISILSSQTPLPPIAVPLVSKDEETNMNSEIQHREITISSEDLKKPQRLWHIPAPVLVNTESDVLLRHRSAPKQLEHLNHSDPSTRESSRCSSGQSNGYNKSIARDNNWHQLKKLPTITDFHDNEASQNEKETFIVRKLSQPLHSSYIPFNNSKELYKFKQDDTASITSEPPLAVTPILQGTAYDISKLRSGARYQVNPETASLIDDIRSSQTTSKNHTHLQYLAAKYQSENVFDMNSDSLEDVISTKQYVSSKTRTGLNPYLRKPKLSTSQQGVTIDGLEGGIGDSFRTLPIGTKPSGLKRGEVMPEMMVRRAEISVTSKRVI